MSVEDLEIKFDQAPMKTAMDVYYEQLLALIPIYKNEKLCLGSTLIGLPFDKEAPQYNNFLVRLLADRTLDYGSPEQLSDDTTLGSPDTSEQFSEQYKSFARLVLNRHLRELPTDVVEKYNFHQNKLTDQLNEYKTRLRALLDEWRTERETNYPGKTDLELELQRATFFNNRKDDVEDLKLRQDAMRRTRVFMTTLLSTGDPRAILAFDVLGAIEDSDQFLPVHAVDEIKYKWDSVWLGNPMNTLGNPTYLDRRASYLNTFDYGTLLKKGERKLEILKTSEHHDSHTRSWSASASGRYGFFFKAKVSASETVATTNAVKAISKVEVVFENLYEVLVGRGSWYNKDVFDKEFIAVGDLEKRLATRLKYAIKSMFIARGLKVYLHFEDEANATYFRQFSASGKGGIKLWGGMLGLGGGGSYNSVSKSDDSKLDRRIVSFADDSDFARMIGYRVEQIHDYVPDGDANPLAKSGSIPLEVMKEILRIQSNTSDFNYDRVLR